MKRLLRQEDDTFGAVAAYPPFLAEGKGQCATFPEPDWFTEDGHRERQILKRKVAVMVCLGCPFRYPCANWALATDQQGVYGATTTAERKAMR